MRLPYRPYRRCKRAYPPMTGADGQRSVRVRLCLCRVQTVVRGSGIFRAWRRGCIRATLGDRSAGGSVAVRVTSRRSHAARHTAPQRCVCTRVAIRHNRDRYRSAGRLTGQRCIVCRSYSVTGRAKDCFGGLGSSWQRLPAPSLLLYSSCTLPLVRDAYTIVLRLLRGRTRGSRKGLAGCLRSQLGHLSFWSGKNLHAWYIISPVKSTVKCLKRQMFSCQCDVVFKVEFG